MTARDLLAAHAEGVALDRLLAYLELLERWSAVHNLVRYRSLEELVRGHLLESLADGGPVGPRGRLLDVGSGAGLPGIPRLCVAPGWSGVLLEPRQKRWAFLRLVIRELALDAVVERCRLEELRPERPGFDSITWRAVGGHAALLASAAAHLAPDGSVLLWLGAAAEAEVRGVSGWRVVSSAPLGRDGGRLVRLEPCFT